MKSFATAGAVIAASLSGVAALKSADLCAQSTVNDGGNFYCKAVNKITYSGFTPGSYEEVTHMDPGTGACNKAPKSYDGPLGPLGEELSLHLRGPVNLTMLAIYNLPAAPAKLARRVGAHERRHAHGHGHLHKRKIGDVVTVPGLGSWVNTYDGGAPAAPAPAPAAGAPAPAGGSKYVPTTPEEVDLADGDWERVANYEQAVKEEAYGLAFLNNQGGASSGVFDTTWGNSLSYASEDGKGCAAESTPWDGTLDSSKEEIIVFSDKGCDDTSVGTECGYSRPGTVAHHGFGGDNKAFLFEIAMPQDGATGANIYEAANMPACWFLNSKIPRTAQYDDCSCWTSGCGEFDALEVLASGDNRCKSTYHETLGGGGGDSNYFDRPLESTKYAVVFSNGVVSIEQLPKDYEFGPKLTSEQVKKLIAADDKSPHASIFSLAG